MNREQYKEVCSATRLYIREVMAGHNRRYKLRKQAECRLLKFTENEQKLAQKAHNLHQNYNQRDEYYVPRTEVYGFVKAMLVTGKAKTVREMLERGMITRG